MNDTAGFDCEVAIAGAGPAGIATALALVKREPGLAGRIVVVDRARFPRDKPCGGGLTGHAALAMAALDLPTPTAHIPAAHALVKYGSFERQVVLRAPVSVIRRWDFDRALVEAASARGVEVREGSAVAGFAIDEQGVTVDTAHGPLRARVLVGADGAGGATRKQLLATTKGGRRTGRPIRLFRAEVSQPPGRYATTMLYDFSPMAAGLRGYLWIFPMPSGGINVGLMHYPSATQPKSGKELVKLLDQWLVPHGVSLDGSERGWPVFGYDTALPLAQPRVLLVGDAAGVDALTGEGIAVGMEHGLLAAEAITQSLTTGNFAMAGYTRAVKRAAVGRELILDGRLAQMLYDGDAYRRWLSLMLFDEKLLQLYADRVAGTLVLADQNTALLGAFVRHVGAWRSRRRRLESFDPRAAEM